MADRDRNRRRTKVHERIRRRLEGSDQRPRLAVFRTLNHIYVQAIDDVKGVTLTQASTLDGELRKKLKSGGNVAAAASVGELIASRLKALGLQRAVFDRGGYLYHGRVKALAEAARKGGLTL